MASFGTEELSMGKSPGIRRVFLDWRRPIVDSFIELLEERSMADRFDYSREWVVVPTRSSGRRLRERLAERASKEGRGVLAPLVTAPDGLIQHALNEDRLASKRELELAWTLALMEVDFARFPVLFPRADTIDLEWARSVATLLLSARSALGESGMDFATVVEAHGEALYEKSRWREMAELERMAGRRLSQLGRLDGIAARRDIPDSPEPPQGVERIWVVGVADPSHLVVDYLKTWAGSMPVEIVIHADPKLQEAFDRYGRPDPELWTRRPIQIETPLSTIRRVEEPVSQGREALRILTELSQSGASEVAVLTADESILQEISRSVGEFGVSVYLPEGTPIYKTALFVLLEVWQSYFETRSFESLVELARHPVVANAAFVEIERSGAELETMSQSELLRRLDMVRERRLPELAEEISNRESKEGERSLETLFARAMDTWASEFLEGGLGSAVSGFLNRMAGDAAVDSEVSDFSAGRSEIEVALSEFDAAESRLAGSVDRAALFRLFIEALRTERTPMERLDSAMEIQGWLEAAWESAGHLVLLGMNDGRVPETVVGDPFLPESLREKLGLRNNIARRGRDAYLLSALLETRRDSGSVHIVFGERTREADPLRPSPLLLQCPDEDLPERALLLFEEKPPLGDEPEAPWSFPWKLRARPNLERPIERVPVTGLREFLRCRFRFYLGYLMGMRRTVDPWKFEWDAREFGNFVHAALEAFGSAEGLRDSESESEIRDFLLETIERKVFGVYGETLPGIVSIQLEYAQRRLAWAAKEQVAFRREGWRIERVEWPFAITDLSGSLSVTGIIDRIDRNERTGGLRVVDYKTGSSGKSPRDAHWSKKRREAKASLYPEWMLVGDAAPGCMWTDLQLPLYRHAIQVTLGEKEPIECGYFLLPQAVTETRYAAWPELTREVFESSILCARSVLAAIEAREFWPPFESRTNDDYDRFLFGRPEEAFDPTSFQD